MHTNPLSILATSYHNITIFHENKDFPSVPKRTAFSHPPKIRARRTATLL